MGADRDHRPGSNPKDPLLPCGVGPGDVPMKPNRSNLPNAMSKTAQVDAPSSYAIAGKVLLAASGAFAGILLALIALHMYNRSRRQHFRHRRRLLRSLALSGAGEERDGAEAPSPRGLDPAVLRALPVLAAGPGAGDCAVCLAEFEPGEKARALPRCGHRFHVECIDAWFRGNSTCPLCRADVEAPDAAAAAEAQPEVRIEVAGATAAAAAKGRAPAMGRLPSGTDLEKTRRIFASTRSASF